MDKIYLLAFAIGLMLLSGCKDDPGNTGNKRQQKAAASILEEKLPGTWEMKYLKIKVDNPDTAYVFEVSEDFWERKYSVKPYRTYFGPDHRFRTAHRGLGGQMISEERGMWNVFGDTLVMITPNSTQQFKVKLEAGTAHFSGIIDWDGDGKETEAYYAIQRYVAKSAQE